MKKIVVIGPESTGKSTLCSELAALYQTVWCPEFARSYLEKNGKEYTYEDLLHIAHGQVQLEDERLSRARNGLYFIDTNMYVMQVWCEYVYQKCHHQILEFIAERKYDLYLLCDIDLPWQFDPLREYPDEAPRQELFRYYHELMVNQAVPWELISGNNEQRLSRAISAINELL